MKRINFFALLFGVILILVLSNVIFADKSQTTDSNELTYKDLYGKMITISRTDFVFFSMMHPPLFITPTIEGENNILLTLEREQGFSMVLGVSLLNKEKNVELKDLIKTAIENDNKNKDSSYEWDPKSLQELTSNDLSMNNAIKGYIVKGNNTKNSSVKMFTQLCFLENQDSDKYFELMGVVCVEPTNPYYNDLQKLNNCFYNLRIEMLTVKFEPNSNSLNTSSAKTDSITQETTINKWKFAYTLPSNKWNLVQSDEDNNLKRALFRYRREAITDSNGNKIMPNIAFVFEEVDKKIDVVNYSVAVRIRTGAIFKNIKSMFVPGDDSNLLKIDNALGYVIEYIDTNNVSHTVDIVHALNNGIGIQVIMDTTTDLYPTVKSEFDSTLKSLKYFND
jgi:hypothetical protein